MRVWRVVKTLVAREVKNETFRNKLIRLRDPLDQVTVRLVGGQQLIRYVNWREPISFVTIDRTISKKAMLICLVSAWLLVKAPDRAPIV